MAEEDFHRGNRKRLIDNKVNKYDETIHTSNVPDPPEETAAPDKSICHGPLIFYPLPPIATDEDITLAATDDQAESMQWHYQCVIFLGDPFSITHTCYYHTYNLQHT